MNEPKIQVGDHVLTEAQSMALRVAASDFYAQLADDEYRRELGPIGDAYRLRMGEILTIFSAQMAATR